jgi:hypothetical protein
MYSLLLKELYTLSATLVSHPNSAGFLQCVSSVSILISHSEEIACNTSGKEHTAFLDEN